MSRMTKEKRDRIAYRISMFGDDLGTEDSISLVKGFDAERAYAETLKQRLEAVKGLKTYNALEVVGETMERGKADMWINSAELQAALEKGDDMGI